MYILLTRISNVTFNPQLVLFDRLPLCGSTISLDLVRNRVVRYRYGTRSLASM